MSSKVNFISALFIIFCFIPAGVFAQTTCPVFSSNGIEGLSSLVVNPGTLSPALNMTDGEMELVNIAANVTSITITPKTCDSGKSITISPITQASLSSDTEYTAVNPTPIIVSSGSTSQPILLAGLQDIDVSINSTINGSANGEDYVIDVSNLPNSQIPQTSTCTSNCSNKNCGDDGCGGSCGTCSADQTCSTSGTCVSNTSIPPQTSSQSNWITLTYTAGKGGHIEGDASQTINEGSQGSEVTAMADSGYAFQKWDDGVSTASRTDSKYTSVTALFTVKPPVPVSNTSQAECCVCIYNSDSTKSNCDRDLQDKDCQVIKELQETDYNQQIFTQQTNDFFTQNKCGTEAIYAEYLNMENSANNTSASKTTASASKSQSSLWSVIVNSITNFLKNLF